MRGRLRRAPTPMEEATIQAAQAYARANGYGDDPKAIGLVLAGMGLMATMPVALIGQFLDEYLRQHPDSQVPFERWARFIQDAAER